MPGSCQRAEKAAKHEGNGDSNFSLSSWNGTQKLGKETGETEDYRMDQDY